MRSVLLVAMLLLVAPSARAQDRLPVDNTVTREAVRVAAGFFGAVPSCGKVRFYETELGLAPGDTPYATAVSGECVVLLDPLMAMLARETRCTFIVHELGHLLGRGHSRRGASVMFWMPGRLVRGCVERFAPGRRVRFAVR